MMKNVARSPSIAKTAEVYLGSARTVEPTAFKAELCRVPAVAEQALIFCPGWAE